MAPTFLPHALDSGSHKSHSATNTPATAQRGPKGWNKRDDQKRNSEAQGVSAQSGTIELTKRVGQERPQLLLEKETMTVQSRPRTVPKDTNGHCKYWTKRQRHCRNQLEEEIGRYQCKNSFNNVKSNVVNSEPSGRRTRKFGHPNPEKAGKKRILNVTL